MLIFQQHYPRLQLSHFWVRGSNLLPLQKQRDILVHQRNNTEFYSRAFRTVSRGIKVLELTAIESMSLPSEFLFDFSSLFLKKAWRMTTQSPRSYSMAYFPLYCTQAVKFSCILQRRDESVSQPFWIFPQHTLCFILTYFSSFEEFNRFNSI